MHGVNPLCIAAQSSRFYFLTPSRRTADGIRSGGERNLIGLRTESDRTADGIRPDGGRYPPGGAAVSAAPTKQTGTFARLMHLLLGWCTYYSVGALETSAPPKRHQHLCRSVKSVGLILSKSKFRGSCYRGCSCLSCTNKANGKSIPTEYAEHTEPSGGDVPPTDRHRCAQIRKVWHPCHTHATNRAND